MRLLILLQVALLLGCAKVADPADSPAAMEAVASDALEAIREASAGVVTDEEHLAQGRHVVAITDDSFYFDLDAVPRIDDLLRKIDANPNGQFVLHQLCMCNGFARVPPVRAAIERAGGVVVDGSAVACGCPSQQ